jgi:hypothetical protein
MCQNRSAQKKYRQKNKTIAEMVRFTTTARADEKRSSHNVFTAAVLRKVREGAITPSEATQRLSKACYYFAKDLKGESCCSLW